MISSIRFRSIHSSKSVTLIPENDSQQDQIFEMLREQDGMLPTHKEIVKTACKHGITMKPEGESVTYCFRTIDPPGAVIYLPDTEEQREKAHYMLTMWGKNNLWNCGSFFAEEFARQHKIPYRVIGRK